MRRKWAFTLIELLVVISIIALLIGILLPALGAARRTARQMQNSTQVRGIQQGCILYAQGNAASGQAGYYPGLQASGLGDSSITAAANVYSVTGPVSVFNVGLARLLNGNFFTPGYLINPGETNTAGIHTSTVITGSATGDTFVGTIYTSYALSQVSYTSVATGGGALTAGADAARAAEWRDNTNTLALILGDRVLDSAGNETTGLTDNPATPTSNARSVWTTTAGDWRGSTVFGDNSTQFLTTQVLTSTKYGSQLNSADNILVGADATTTATNGNAKLFRSTTN